MIFLIFGSLILSGLAPTSCERLREQIYSSISASNSCFRRLNGTHQAGCSSPRNGGVGVVHMIKHVEDAKWLLTNDAVAGPYIAVISTLLFNDVIELFMENPDNIAGVLVFDKNDSTYKAKSFSQESNCPNEYASDPESQCSKAGVPTWNTKGSGLLRRDVPFSIVFSPAKNSEDIDKIEECFERYNKNKENQRNHPLCSLEINAFMFAAVNSEVCLRRSHSQSLVTVSRVCDPIGDFNVYYPLFPRVEKEEKSKEDITLVTARVDAASLFDNLAPGASSSVVGIVTLLTTATILAKMIPESDADKYDSNVLFTFFNGEAFDYVGSQRVAYDMSRGQWPENSPLSPSDIRLHVEVGQIGGALQNNQIPTDTWPMHAFAPSNHTEVQDFLAEMTRNYDPSSIIPQVSVNMPPSSIHSFRRILKKLSPPALVLVDHGDQFTNMFYNSALDEYYQLGYEYRNITIGPDGTFQSTEDLIATGVMAKTDVQVKISQLATALAYTLYKRVVKASYSGELTVSAHLVDEMLYCYTQSLACPLMQAVDYGGNDPENLSPAPPSMYASVAHFASNPAVFTAHLAVLLTGTDLRADSADCKAMEASEYSFYWLMGWNHTGVCLRTSVNMSEAFSPAFSIEDYDMSSGQYSTWTESIWRGLSVRLFVSAGGAGAVAAMASGVIATAVAAFLTFWFMRHKDRIFVNSATPTATDEATSGKMIQARQSPFTYKAF